jgi:hypothetical protein
MVWLLITTYTINIVVLETNVKTFLSAWGDFIGAEQSVIINCVSRRSRNCLFSALSTGRLRAAPRTLAGPTLSAGDLHAGDAASQRVLPLERSPGSGEPTPRP